MTRIRFYLLRIRVHPLVEILLQSKIQNLKSKIQNQNGLIFFASAGKLPFRKVSTAGKNMSGVSTCEM